MLTMKKLGLKPEMLAVESFEADASAAHEGTVYAQESIGTTYPCFPRTEIQTCRRNETCTSVYQACIC
jgi:hypothetical protein